jgi:hypothetical protein
MAYVYRHIRLDKNEPFYIGIGNDDGGKFKRAFSKKSRNIHWNRIVENSDYKIQILFDELDWNNACIKEKELISLYKRKSQNKDGILCNMTDGGDGVCGYSPTQEWRISHSNKLKGRKMAEHVRVRMIGRLNTIETKIKMSLAQSKEKHWNFGKEMPDNVRITLLKSISGANSKRSKILINEQNGVFYDTMKEASEAYQIIYSTLRSKLNGKGKNDTYLRYA